MEITLIRHTSVAVAVGICYGQSDVDVAHSFPLEAENVKSGLKKKQFDQVFCSPLIRCKQLADYCGYSTVKIDNRIMELNFGDWELINWDKITDPQLEKWYKDWVDESPSNGESFSEMIKRVDEFYKELLQSDFHSIAIFTHAGVIRIFEMLINKVPLEKAFQLKINYGQIITHSK